MEHNEQFAVNRADLALLNDELECGKLYKIFMLIPLEEKYFNVASPGSIRFTENFLEYFNRVMLQETVLFTEDNPREHHQFAQSDRAMLTLLVPPNLVLCINGDLVLKKDQVIKECILGVYLFNDSDQFFTNIDFDSHLVGNWLVETNAQPSSTLRHSEA